MFKGSYLVSTNGSANDTKNHKTFFVEISESSFFLFKIVNKTIKLVIYSFQENKVIVQLS